MRARPHRLVLFFFIVALATSLFSHEVPTVERQAPQTSETSHWDLGLITTDADLSPDDRLVALTRWTEHPSARVDSERAVSVELWDYHQHRLITATRVSSGNPDCRSRTNAIRFTADGSLIVVAVACKVHLLEATTLKSVRVIEPALRANFEIGAIETSPVSRVAIIAADEGNIYGVLFAYELDTGRQLLQWESPGAVHSISWKPDGTEFAIATPFPCAHIGNEVRVFSAETWAPVQVLSAKNAESVAFSNDLLYTVQTSECKGSLFNHHLGLEEFKVGKWKHKTVFVPHTDIHDSVSFANGRLLTDTGTVKTDYDWSDMVGYAFATNAQITIWKGEAQPTILTLATSALAKHRSGVRMRLSRTGKMVLLNPQNPQIFQVP